MEPGDAGFTCEKPFLAGKVEGIFVVLFLTGKGHLNQLIISKHN